MKISFNVMDSLLDLLESALDEHDTHIGVSNNPNHWSSMARQYIQMLAEPATKTNPVMYRLIRSPKGKMYTRDEFINLCNASGKIKPVQDETGFTPHQICVITARLRYQGFDVKPFTFSQGRKKKKDPTNNEGSMLTG